MTKEQIDQLKQQLNEKLAEVKEIYNQLVEAGEAPLPDDILDVVGGGGIGPTPSCRPEDYIPIPKPDSPLTLLERPD